MGGEWLREGVGEWKKNRIAKTALSAGDPPPAYYAGGGAVLAWPAVVEQIMITLVQYVDTAMVGSLGSAATAAVGLTASTTWLFNGFLNAASVGFFCAGGPASGRRPRNRSEKVTWQALRFVGIFGAAIGLLALALSLFPCQPCWGAEESIRGDASLYFRIIACAMPFTLAPICSAPPSAAQAIPVPL